MGIQEGKRIVRLNTIGKIGLIATGASVASLVTIAILAGFRNGGTGGFTIQIDNPSTKNHVYMTTDPSGTNTVLLSGTPIEKMYPTNASKVEQYLSTFTASTIGGEHNMPDPNESRPDYYVALVFTVFLSNYDKNLDQKLAYEVSLDSYVAPGNGAQSTLDYMRIVVQTSTLDGDSLTRDLNTTYFGAPNNSNFGTTEGKDDNRECISDWSQTTDGDSYTIRQSDYIGLSKDGYCTNFLEDKNNNILATDDLVIKPLQTMRFTFVGYLEGNDPDCKSFSPDSSVLLMSLHFGERNA